MNIKKILIISISAIAIVTIAIIGTVLTNCAEIKSTICGFNWELGCSEVRHVECSVFSEDSSMNNFAGKVYSKIKLN